MTINAICDFKETHMSDDETQVHAVMKTFSFVRLAIIALRFPSMLRSKYGTLPMGLHSHHQKFYQIVNFGTFSQPQRLWFSIILVDCILFLYIYWCLIDIFWTVSGDRNLCCVACFSLSAQIVDMIDPHGVQLRIWHLIQVFKSFTVGFLMVEIYSPQSGQTSVLAPTSINCAFQQSQPKHWHK